MKLREGKELREEIDARTLTEQQKLIIAIKCSQEVLALHDTRVVHADVKPENFMILFNPENPHDIFVKAIDFDVSKIIEKGKKEQPFEIASTPDYRAVEMTTGKFLLGLRVNYGKPVDIYSLGVMFKKDLKISEPKMDYLIAKMMQENPDERPLIHEVVFALGEQLEKMPQDDMTLQLISEISRLKEEMIQALKNESKESTNWNYLANKDSLVCILSDGKQSEALVKNLTEKLGNENVEVIQEEGRYEISVKFSATRDYFKEEALLRSFVNAFKGHELEDMQANISLSRGELNGLNQMQISMEVKDVLGNMDSYIEYSALRQALTSLGIKGKLMINESENKTNLTLKFSEDDLFVTRNIRNFNIKLENRFKKEKLALTQDKSPIISLEQRREVQIKALQEQEKEREQKKQEEEAKALKVKAEQEKKQDNAKIADEYTTLFKEMSNVECYFDPNENTLTIDFGADSNEQNIEAFSNALNAMEIDSPVFMGMINVPVAELSQKLSDPDARRQFEEKYQNGLPSKAVVSSKLPLSQSLSPKVENKQHEQRHELRFSSTLSHKQGKAETGQELKEAVNKEFPNEAIETLMDRDPKEYVNLSYRQSIILYTLLVQAQKDIRNEPTKRDLHATLEQKKKALIGHYPGFAKFSLTELNSLVKTTLEQRKNASISNPSKH